MTEVEQLRKRITELEKENENLKEELRGVRGSEKELFDLAEDLEERLAFAMALQGIE